MTHPDDAAAPTTPAPLKRRGLLLGAGAAGAALVAAKVLPGAPAAAPVAAAASAAVDTASAGGYQLTAHVLRYYETTRA